MPVKEFWKSVNIWQQYGQDFGVFYDSWYTTEINDTERQSCVCYADVSAGSSCKQTHDCIHQDYTHTLSYMRLDFVAELQLSALLSCCPSSALFSRPAPLLCHHVSCWASLPRCVMLSLDLQLETNVVTLGSDVVGQYVYRKTKVECVLTVFSAHTHTHTILFLFLK